MNCLDAETLAAWTDGGLKGAALADVQAHVAGCERCQMLLGAMGQTRSAVPANEPGHMSRRWLAWGIPLTAAATAVAIWVAIPEQKQAPLPTAAVPVSPASPSEPAETAPLQKSDTPQPPAAKPAASPRPAAPPAQDTFARQNSGTFADTAPPAAAPPPPALRAEQRESKAEEVQQRASAVARDARAFCGPPPPPANAGQLTTSSAPSADVCWLAGRGGLVLRSVDGRTWQRLDFPETTDLTAVTATDASTAIVTDAEGRTFGTTDGGVSWMRR